MRAKCFVDFPEKFYHFFISVSFGVVIIARFLYPLKDSSKREKCTVVLRF